MDGHMDEAGQEPSALEALLLAPVGVDAADLQRVQDRLRKRETALRAVLEGLPDATVAAGRDGRIIFANALAETLFGYEHDELLGKPVQTLWPERVRKRYTRNMDLYFATEHPLRFTIRADGLRRDGTEFVGEMSWGIVETEVGPILLAIGRDMTAHREAMARLQRQSSQQAAVAALGERALSGADGGDLAVEAVERMHETLPLRRVAVQCDGEELAGWGAPEPGAQHFEIFTGEDVFGEIAVVADSPLGEDEENFVRGVANVLAVALGRLRGEERMRHDALHDPLTGLANRALCRERLIHALARASRDDGAACVLFIDLDDFKGVNDLYGHAAGDALLIALSRRLVTTVRPADTVARLGGDEFVVVCEDIDETTAIGLGSRLTEAIHEPLDVDGIEHRLSASIGIALGAAGRRDPDALLADADAAAYRAKAAGRGRVEVFDRRLRPHARERPRPAAAPARAGAAAPGGGAGARVVAGATAAGLPADRRAGRPAGRRPRGAAALGLAGRRDERAGGFHPGGGGVGADRGDRGVDADAGLPRERRGLRREGRRAVRLGQPRGPSAGPAGPAGARGRLPERV